MTRLMFDGINSDASAIARNFPGAALVAGYIDGLFQWGQADWNLFPHAVHVQIAISASSNAGDVIDCENGDATPVQAASWVRKRKAAGYYRPTIYCNMSTVQAVRQATGNLILGRDYDIWIADYDGSQSDVYKGAAAKQYLSEADWDFSVVYDSGWPHRTAPKPPAPATYGPPLKLEARAGHTSVELSWSRPAAVPGLPAASWFEVFIYRGRTCNTSTLVKTYPRAVGNVLEYQGGSLAENTAYTAHVVAGGANGSHVRPYTYASAEFTTGS
jgi:hypothetical protein